MATHHIKIQYTSHQTSTDHMSCQLWPHITSKIQYTSNIEYASRHVLTIHYIYLSQSDVTISANIAEAFHRVVFKGIHTAICEKSAAEPTDAQGHEI